MIELIGRVNNGNYVVELWSDGTKIRYNGLDFFEPHSVESMDLKITNCCDMGCAMCHENSTPDGKHGDILNVPFFDTLLPYTEIAVGGGNVLIHPDLVPFLEQLKERKLIANMTVNQHHFMKNIDFIIELVDKKLIYGIGVSLNDPTDGFIETIGKFPNSVVHIINGLITMDKLQYMAHKGLKILVLGYKDFRRGSELYKRQNVQIEQLKSAFYEALPKVVEEEWFEVISFDNLAIEQLNPKRLMSDEEWTEFFMGSDGDFTMYIDLVEEKFAKSSTSTDRYDLEDDIKTMFNKVRSREGV